VAGLTAQNYLITTIDEERRKINDPAAPAMFYT
jgi:hypothetical protein